MTFLSRLGALAAAFFVMMGTALAAPQDYMVDFQHPVTPVMERIKSFHDVLLVISVAICVLVLGLLLWVAIRYNEKRNPTPSKTTHNVVLELAWTVIPVLILIAIAFPSFRLLYFADRAEDAELTIKAIGRQWYWSYEYPDNGNFTFDAFIVQEADLQPGQPRLLTTDNAVVLPVDTNIRILVTASDVLHNFAMPQFGLKMDAVPGRVNETWAYVPAEFAGQTFYGQCSELCGTGHAYMPIMIRMVTKEEYAAWTEQAREQFAKVDAPRAPAAVAEMPAGNNAADDNLTVATAPAGVPQSK